MNEDIVVSGMGIITGLGYGKDQTLKSLCLQHSGIGKINYLETIHTDYPVSEVKMSDNEMRNSLKIPSEKIITRTPLLGIMALSKPLMMPF